MLRLEMPLQVISPIETLSVVLAAGNWAEEFSDRSAARLHMPCKILFHYEVFVAVLAHMRTFAMPSEMMTEQLSVPDLIANSESHLLELMP